MSFSSVSFYVFMFAVFFIYWGIPHKFRYILLALANLIFYLSFGVKFLPILIAEIIIAYFGARVLEKKKDKKGDKKASKKAQGVKREAKKEAKVKKSKGAGDVKNTVRKAMNSNKSV